MIRAGELGPKNVRVLSTRETLRRVPSEGICHGSGKVQYRTRKLALQALALARKLPDWHPGLGSVYRCGHGCTAWHFTHLPEERAA